MSHSIVEPGQESICQHRDSHNQGQQPGDKGYEGEGFFLKVKGPDFVGNEDVVSFPDVVSCKKEELV